MLLVPRQLQRSGMTGAVPYYGGRLTPAQAYAASHPQGAPPNQSPTAWNPVATAAAAPPAPPAPLAPPPSRADTPAALKHLLDSGVLTRDEYDALLARTRR
jgi:hypothetical protein